MAQWEKGLLNKHKDLGLTPGTHRGWTWPSIPVTLALGGRGRNRRLLGTH